MKQAVALKVIYNTGLIEDIKSAIVIAEETDGMFYEAMNILPDKQMLVIAMAFHSMLREMRDADTDGVLEVLEHELLEFIRSLMNPSYIRTQQQTKGDVLQ
jgi:hypothetical protein